MDRLDRDLNASVLMTCVLRHKMRFLLVLMVCFSAMSLAMLAVTPSYEVSSVLIGGQPDLEPITNAVRRSSDSGVSLAGIAESEDVLRAAIAEVGLAKLIGSSELSTMSIFEQARAALLHAKDEVETLVHKFADIDGHHRTNTRPASGTYYEPVNPSDAAFTLISRAVKVKAEPNSDIIRISFRHKDPVVAAAFANALSRAFIDRQAALFGKAGASEFFQAQSVRFSDELKKVSNEFRDFMASSGVYSIEEQRQLLLRRRNDVTLSLASTRGSIADKSAQKSAIVNQLRKLAPVARSPFVSSVVNSLSDDRAERSVAEGRPATDFQSGESPLLLVKVYQDSMAALFKLDSELAGLDKFRDAQTADLDTISRDLSRLASNEYRYMTLKRAVGVAEENKVAYEKRMTDEKINSESRAANFLAVKVVQKATPPSSPVFPNYGLVTAMALIVSLLAATFAAGRAGLRRMRRRTQPDGERVGFPSMVTP